jgi:hypothetical protein
MGEKMAICRKVKPNEMILMPDGSAVVNGSERTVTLVRLTPQEVQDRNQLNISNKGKQDEKRSL